MRPRCIALVLPLAGWLGSCASSVAMNPEMLPPPEPAMLPPPTPAEPAPTPAGPGPEPAAPRNLGADGATAVEGGAGLVRLCEAMRDEAGMSFPGNAVAQAKAREEQALRRQAAEAGRYVAIVPPQGFAFGEYDLTERRLLLDASRGFRLADGAELSPSLGDSPLGFPLSAESADRMLVRRAAGKLFLRVVFRPVRSQLRNQACQWVSGGRVVRLEADVEAVALIDRDGRTLSRGGSRDATLELDTPVTGPVVTARRPRLADGGDVSDALAEAVNELAGAALPCYQKALAARPNLRGTMVVGLRVAGDGRIDAPRMEMSTLGDDALTACVTSRLGKARLAGGPARISLPLVFGSKDDR